MDQDEERRRDKPKTKWHPHIGRVEDRDADRQVARGREEIRQRCEAGGKPAGCERPQGREQDRDGQGQGHAAPSNGANSSAGGGKAETDQTVTHRR